MSLNDLLKPDAEIPKNDTLDKVYEQALQNYVAAIEHIYTMMSGMSARNIMRATLSAIDLNIDLHCPVQLQKKDVDLAALIAKTLDLRTIIQANRLRLEQQEKSNEN
jgi:hypothetical protein